MPENKEKAAKKLRRWNPLRLFKGKIPEKDSDLSRAAYGAYRREKGRSPETILETMSYTDWKKARKIHKKAARPGE